jgi:16S rRNA C1402 (ribose-2'-O) methylase RsmI
MEVGCLKLQHLVDTGAVDLIRCLEDFLVVTLTAESRSDQLLAVLVQQVECWLVSTGRNLDQLCETVSYLTLWQGLQEREVKECVHGGVVRSETVLVVAVVDSDLDADTSINQANDGSWDTDEVGVPSVRGASKSTITS